MHLAIVTPYPPNITGIGQYGYHVSHLLAQSGLFSQINVLTGKSSGQVHVPPSIEIQYAWRPGQWNTGRDIPAYLRRTRPDLVWLNLGVSVFGGSPLANLLGFVNATDVNSLGLPTVVTMHELPVLADLRALKAPGGPLALLGAHLLTRIATRADVVCLTMRRYIEWLAPRQPGTRFVHIPIGAYRTPELLAESDAQELLFFTTLAPYKGPELLLEAFCTLQKDYPSLRLTIAGVEHFRFPGYAQKLRSKFRDLSGVRWLGQVVEEDVRELFRRAQIVVLPYTASTGASSVLTQAAMWGRAIVASDLPENQAIARESGLDVTFFQRGQVSALVEALGGHLDSDERRRSQVEHNFASIQNFRPDFTFRAYLHAFNRALEVRRSPKRIAIPANISAESA